MQGSSLVSCQSNSSVLISWRTATCGKTQNVHAKFGKCKLKDRDSYKNTRKTFVIFVSLFFLYGYIFVCFFSPFVGFFVF